MCDTRLSLSLVTILESYSYFLFIRFEIIHTQNKSYKIKNY